MSHCSVTTWMPWQWYFDYDVPHLQYIYVDKIVCLVDCKFTFWAHNLIILLSERSKQLAGDRGLAFRASQNLNLLPATRPCTMYVIDRRPTPPFLHCEREDDTTAVVFVIRRKRTWFWSRRLAYASCICGAEWTRRECEMRREECCYLFTVRAFGPFLLVYKSPTSVCLSGF